MAIVARVEAAFPQARGGANYDDTLRAMLVPWVNDLIYELSQMQRWSYEYQVYSQLTVPGQAVYPFSGFTPTATGLTAIKRIYYIDTAGYPRELERRERWEAARMLGDTTLPRANAVPLGSPREFSINDGQELEIFPPPNNAGFDSGGNYELLIQGYQLMSPIVETTGITITGNPNLTVSSTPYLTDSGVPSAGQSVSIRGAGNAQFTGIKDNFVTNWTAFTSPTSVTMGANAPFGLSSLAYFNSQPWIITWWPKLVEFGVLREVATYLKDEKSYQLYEQRYQSELTLLRAYEYDRMRGVEMAAASHAGQYTPVDRRLDLPVGLDVRGIL